MCSFAHFNGNLTCSDDNISIASLSSDLRVSYLSDVGLLDNSITQNFSICNNHQQRFHLNHKNRSKGKYCAIPDYLNTHQCVKRIGERKVNHYLLSAIHSTCGIVIPIGSAICTSCRKLLVQHPCNEVSELPEPHHNEDKENHEDTSYFDVIVCTEKRKRDCAKAIDYSFPLSDSEPEMTPSVGCSQVSEASVCNIGKLDKLNDFLMENQLSPVKTISTSLQESSGRSKQRYVEKAKACLTAMFETMCPGEGNLLQDMVLKEIFEENDDHTTESPLTEMMIKIFKNGETWTFKRQILSMLTKHVTYKMLHEEIPELSQWQYYCAKRHANTNFCQEITKEPVQREKLDSTKLEHFIDFITSSDIIKDLPFGQRNLRLSSGEVIQIPNVIRCLAPSSIVEQYTKVCEEENFVPMGSSTLYKVLSNCGASVRQCMDGLDYFITEGGRAFKDLMDIVDQLKLSKEEETRLKDGLSEGKHYLKTEYKVHVAKTSLVKDHCRVFALNDPKEQAFQSECDHDHDHDSNCEKCTKLAVCLEEVQKLATEATWDNAEATLFEVEKALRDIEDWKKHVVRARNQEDARIRLLDSLTAKEVLITCDWAMKFLPRKYREGQTDWFAKRGINWHISVSLHKTGETRYSTTTHVHIFDQPVSQDSSTTTSLILDVINDLKKLLPDVTAVHLFSDNAGCYKSTNTLCGLHTGSSGIVKSYNFCEAQNGKGPCDRKSSNLKSLIKRHINEGNDVINAQQMKQAIDKKQTGLYRVKVVEEIIVIDQKQSIVKPIQNISLLHNFTFSPMGMTVWKQFGIGNGKSIHWSKLLGEDAEPKIANFIVHMDWTQQVKLDEFIDQSTENEDEEPPKKKRATELFYCELEGCGRSFATKRCMENHMLLGSCNFREEKQSLCDRAKSIYSDKLLISNAAHQINLSATLCSNVAKENTLNTGWALKSTKQRVVFNENQKEYVREQFQKGKKTGNKVDPYAAAVEMRNIVVNGKPKFSRAEFLTGQQIASYFSRISQQERKMDQYDFEAANEEIKKEDLKNTLIRF